MRPLPIAAVLAVFAAAGPPVARAHAPHDPILALALSPDFERDGTLFVAIQGFSLLLRSTDRGQGFETIHAGLESAFVQEIAVSPHFATDRTLFVTDGRRVSMSRDAGDHWAPVELGTPLGALGLVHAIHARDLDGRVALRISGEQASLLVAPRGPDEGDGAADGEGEDPPGRLVLVQAPSPGPRGAPLRRIDPTPGTPFAAALDAQGPLASVGGVFVGRPLPGGVTATAACVAGRDAEDARLYVGTDEGALLVAPADPRQGEWRPLGALPGGPVRDVAVRPGRDGRPVVFAATSAGGLFEKHGTGRWTSERAGLRPPSAQSDEHAFAIVPSPAYAADGLVYAATFEGLYVRTGDSPWRHLATLPHTLVRDAALSQRFDEDGRLWVCAYGDGLLQSDDRGASWAPLDSGPWLWPDGVGASPDFGEDGTIVLGTPVKQLVSRDAGATWSVALERAGGFADRVRFSPDYARDATIFMQLLDYEGSATSTLVVSRDGGETWRDAPPEGVTAFALAPDYAASGRLFVATTSGLLASRDRGETFAAVETPRRALDAVATARGEDGPVLVVASVREGLAVRRGDEGAWTSGGPPAPVSLLRAATDARGRAHLFAGTRTDGVFVSRDAGASWERSEGAPQCVLALDVAPDASGGVAVLAGGYDGPRLSRDGARTWTRVLPTVRSPRAGPGR